MSLDNLGMGVMLHILGDNSNSAKAFEKGLNKKIVGLNIDNDTLIFDFEDGYRMGLFDDGQSCCESRYMVCDDDLDPFVGATFINCEVRDAPNEEDEYGEHEVQFLLVNTSIGTFTIASHNEHNGYYGGFWVVAKDLSDVQS